MVPTTVRRVEGQARKQENRLSVKTFRKMPKGEKHNFFICNLDSCNTAHGKDITRSEALYIGAGAIYILYILEREKFERL